MTDPHPRLDEIAGLVRPLHEVIDESLLEDERSIGPHFVWWDEISAADVDLLRSGLDAARSEHDLQALLSERPLLLIQHLGGGHGRWVVPKARLGAEHVTDFMIGERSSLGYEWIAVELENPSKRSFTRAGQTSADLTHAIDQVQDWRRWLAQNLDYARRPKAGQGLGLLDISPDPPGLIIIGRRNPTTDLPEKRRQIERTMNITIHSYDWLVDQAAGRVVALERYRSSADPSTNPP